MSIPALVMTLFLFFVVVAILLMATKFAVNAVPRKPNPPLALPENQTKELTGESV